MFVYLDYMYCTYIQYGSGLAEFRLGEVHFWMLLHEPSGGREGKGEEGGRKRQRERECGKEREREGGRE